MKKNVCVLVVTYNRKEYLVKCLEALLNQSYKISKILIFDNFSTDGTFETLKEKKYVTEKKIDEISKNEYNGVEFLYYFNSFNGGGSFGFSKGIELAYNENIDYIWTMDDDVLPDQNCLSILIDNLKNRKMCIPNRTDDRFEDKAITSINMTNPFKHTISARQKVVYSKDLSEDSIDVVNMPFEGPIFDRKIVDEFGLPNKDLFIIFDDTDFAYRVSQKEKIAFIKNAILHKQIIPSNDSKRLMNWKNYYGLRNQYWFDRKYGKNIFVRKFRPIFSKYDLIIRAIVKRKFSNIKIIKAAYYDGTHDILGKKVNPGSEFIWKKEN